MQDPLQSFTFGTFLYDMHGCIENNIANGHKSNPAFKVVSCSLVFCWPLMQDSIQLLHAFAGRAYSKSQR